jgi:predicted ABC-type ATPase
LPSAKKSAAFVNPNVYIIAGPNGAGKTTFAREFLPYYADCTNFINADLIAQGVSPFSPSTAAFRAGRLMLSEITRCAKRRADFGFETTLSGHSHLKLVRDLKKDGYQLQIFYLWVPTVELALSRVEERVMKGGHDVPESVVRRRFRRSIKNSLAHYCLLADSWTLFNNSGRMPSIMAYATDKKPCIIDEEQYKELVHQHGEI